MKWRLPNTKARNKHVETAAHSTSLRAGSRLSKPGRSPAHRPQPSRTLAQSELSRRKKDDYQPQQQHRTFHSGRPNMQRIKLHTLRIINGH
jgi:hypothetical protein